MLISAAVREKWPFLTIARQKGLAGGGNGVDAMQCITPIVVPFTQVGERIELPN